MSRPRRLALAVVAAVALGVSVGSAVVPVPSGAPDVTVAGSQWRRL